MKIVNKIQLKIFIFTAMKNRCLLHGHVFVMSFKECSTSMSQLIKTYILLTGTERVKHVMPKALEASSPKGNDRSSESQYKSIWTF